MVQGFSKVKQKKGVAWLLLFMMCFSFMDGLVFARAAYMMTGLYDKAHNPNTNVFTIYGRHKYISGEVWTYRTKGFNVASDGCADVTNPPIGVKAVRLAINQNSSTLRVSEQDMYTESVYTITGSDFANAFQTLFQDGINKAVAQGKKSYTATMYFNNIFQVVYRAYEGVDRYYSGASMSPQYSFMSAEEYHTAASIAGNPYVAAWSEGDFSGFYNYPYTYTVQILETKINYVNKKTGQIIKEDAARVYGLNGGTGRYTLPEKVFTVDGKFYTYDGTYAIDYKDGSNPMVAPSVDGRLSWTIRNDNMEVDVYFTEDTSRKKVPVIINIELGDDKQKYRVVKTFDSGCEVFTGEEFVYVPALLYQDEDGVKYTYSKSWYYTYTDIYGDLRYVTDVDGAEPNLNPVPDVKSETSLNIYIRYDRDDDITPMPTFAVSPIPTSCPVPTKGPSSDQESPKNEGVVSKDVAVPTSGAVIKAEEKYGHRYDVELGIATQEDLYAEGGASEFILGYHLYHVTGVKTYPIRVEKKYILRWGDSMQKEEEVNVSTTINVTRGYGYWEIGSFQYYIPAYMTLYNYALPNGKVSMPVLDSKINPPAVSSCDYSNNMDDPETYKYGIKLPTETIDSENGEKPAVPRMDFEILAYNAAHTGTGNIKVRNDYLYYNTDMVLDSSWTEYCAQSVNSEVLKQHIGKFLPEIFFQGNMIIDAEKDNGTYNSSGNICYKASAESIAAETEQVYLLSREPNPVIIHTPVYCEGVITADNERYVQLINPIRNAVQLVLDEDNTLNDFFVKVNNTGMHNVYLGYGVRDYSRILRLSDDSFSNIAKDVHGELRNEVKFPFDVYMDIGNDGRTENDIYYPAETWFVLGRDTQRFYLPLTVKEGSYNADFRTIAVNANGRLTQVQKNANTDQEKYVVTDKVLIEVSGRVYGLTVYDINDYPVWEEVFRIPQTLHLKINNQDKYPLGVNSTKYSKNNSYNYTVGTKNQYGRDTGRNAKFTFPLVVGSHPYYGNIGILKRGYSVRFNLDTIGNYYADSAAVTVYPSYYWVDENGKNRAKVDMYYDAEIEGKHRTLIKSGEALDLTNVVAYRAGDRKLGIPETELSITAKIRNILLGKWEWQYANLVFGTFKVHMSASFRTYRGGCYAEQVINGPNKLRVAAAGVTEADIIKSKQGWYGEIFIPGTARFVEEGFDVLNYARYYGIDYRENFWKKDGYIIMNLEIKVHDNIGNEKLSYVNKINEKRYCNMWQLEGAPISKASEIGPVFSFEDGDFMIYSVEQSATDDYVVGGIY